jgi:hypothetical protein
MMAMMPMRVLALGALPGDLCTGADRAGRRPARPRLRRARAAARPRLLGELCVGSAARATPMKLVDAIATITATDVRTRLLLEIGRQPARRDHVYQESAAERESV